MSNWKLLNAFRVRNGNYGSSPESGFTGAFALTIPGEARRVLCLSCDEGGWQHVSVSLHGTHKTPSWELMSKIKDLFFEPEDAVIQLHPPASQHINMHPGCLHLWRCVDGREFPLPPSIMVGIKTAKKPEMPDHNEPPVKRFVKNYGESAPH